MQSVVLVTASIAAGRLSDRTGRRKVFVLSASIVYGLAMFVVAIASSFNGFLVGMAISGIGFGTYMAVDLALVADVLPDNDNIAKDLGVFNIAGALPFALAPAIAPAILLLGGGSYSRAVRRSRSLRDRGSLRDPAGPRSALRSSAGCRAVIPGLRVRGRRRPCPACAASPCTSIAAAASSSGNRRSMTGATCPVATSLDEVLERLRGRCRLRRDAAERRAPALDLSLDEQPHRSDDASLPGDSAAGEHEGPVGPHDAAQLARLRLPTRSSTMS